ncbi:hypothetical protein AK812_SmicGene4616 [Symbiodinium microadriaticum]|uniref:Uncharacterized protein n=1 Tax=Symbiodinium microadriaticum TaxID=2951 RepID=A0A1Q9EVZ4_SYMMI|nr:hypothetical protein AK812_SmicGene4616 [Symbiodinium microadriaticum]
MTDSRLWCVLLMEHRTGQHAGALQQMLAGKSEEELGLSPAKVNAFLLLIHLADAVKKEKTLLSKIFRAENKGPPRQQRPAPPLD